MNKELEERINSILKCVNGQTYLQQVTDISTAFIVVLRCAVSDQVITKENALKLAQKFGGAVEELFDSLDENDQ